MYLVKTKVGESSIDGRGVFAAERIAKGKTVWVYDPTKDLAVTKEDFRKLDLKEQERFIHSAYLSPWTNLWICPPAGDDGEYTNHGSNNNLTAVYDNNVSSEPYFVANRDIEAGEEITNNYHEFDALTRKEQPGWTI